MAIDLKELTVRIRKTNEIGYISACTIPLKDDVNYCVWDKKQRIKKWYYGSQIELTKPYIYDTNTNRQ